MKTGHCPKCNSTDIFASDSNVGIQRGDVFTLPLGGVLDGVMTFQATDYVCTNCGYWETYIEDNKVLEKIAEMAAAGKRWKRVK